MDESWLCSYSLTLSPIDYISAESQSLSFHLVFFLLSYLAITSPEDVARVEKQTYVCTTKKEDSVPTPAPRVESVLGNWKDPQEMDKEMESKFQGSMEGEPLSSLFPFLPTHSIYEAIIIIL